MVEVARMSATRITKTFDIPYNETQNKDSIGRTWVRWSERAGDGSRDPPRLARDWSGMSCLGRRANRKQPAYLFVM